MRCIKRIKLNNGSEAMANTHIKMIQREIYLLQNLAHPRIISLLGYFCSETGYDYIYIVMEYASLGSLSKIIAEQNAKHQFFDEQVSYQSRNTIILCIQFSNMMIRPLSSPFKSNNPRYQYLKLFF